MSSSREDSIEEMERQELLARDGESSIQLQSSSETTSLNDGVNEQQVPELIDLGKRRNESWMTFVSVFSMMFFPLGVGPAFGYTGWIPGLAMLFYAAFASYKSGMHLGDMCTRDKVVETYPKLAKLAGGSRGEGFVCAVQTLLYFSCGVFNIAYMPANFEQLFFWHRGDWDNPSRNYHWYYVTWGIMCGGSLLPSYHDTLNITIFSAIVSSINAFLQVVVIIFYQWEDRALVKTSLVGEHLLQLLSALPAIAYTFGGHGVFPEEIREMKHPKEFPKMVRRLYACSVPIYLLCGIFSYHAYGNDINGNPILNWPLGLWITRLAAFFSLIGALVISITSNQATLIAIENNIVGVDAFQPILRFVKRDIVRNNCGRVPKVTLGEGKTAKDTRKALVRILIRISFVTAQLIVALALRKTPLQFLQAFMGSVGVGFLTLTAPFLIYMKLNKGTLSTAKMAQSWTFLVLGSLVVSVGVICSTAQMTMGPFER